MKKLGRIQASLLRAMNDTKGRWYPMCGWHWISAHFTAKVLHSMVKHGLVTEHQVPSTRGAWTYTEFRLTAAGKKVANNL